MRRRWHDDEVGLYSGCSLVIGCSEWLVWRDVATETWNHLFSKNKALSRFRATWWWNMETMKQIIHMFSYSTLPLHNYRMEWNHCAGGTLNWTSCGCVCCKKMSPSADCVFHVVRFVTHFLIKLKTMILVTDNEIGSSFARPIPYFRELLEEILFKNSSPITDYPPLFHLMENLIKLSTMND